MPTFLKNIDHVKQKSEYFADLKAHRLPQVVFIDNSAFLGDEHPSADYHVGAREAAKLINAFIQSDYWSNGVFFLTYDEAGGFYDHVPPPESCAPDDLDPEKFQRYGFRVPFIAISPYAKRHFVSHVTYDHTSILKFIETKYNLPALTRRDANADAMTDLFNFSIPRFERPNLQLPSARVKPFVRCLWKGME
jgi:phospholipase C